MADLKYTVVRQTWDAAQSQDYKVGSFINPASILITPIPSPLYDDKFYTVITGSPTPYQIVEFEIDKTDVGGFRVTKIFPYVLPATVSNQMINNTSSTSVDNSYITANGKYLIVYVRPTNRAYAINTETCVTDYTADFNSKITGSIYFVHFDQDYKQFYLQVGSTLYRYDAVTNGYATLTSDVYNGWPTDINKYDVSSPYTEGAVARYDYKRKLFITSLNARGQNGKATHGIFFGTIQLANGGLGLSTGLFSNTKTLYQSTDSTYDKYSGQNIIGLTWDLFDEKAGICAYTAHSYFTQTNTNGTTTYTYYSYAYQAVAKWDNANTIVCATYNNSRTQSLTNPGTIYSTPPNIVLGINPDSVFMMYNQTSYPNNSTTTGPTGASYYFQSLTASGLAGVGTQMISHTNRQNSVDGQLARLTELIIQARIVVYTRSSDSGIGRCYFTGVDVFGKQMVYSVTLFEKVTVDYPANGTSLSPYVRSGMNTFNLGNPASVKLIQAGFLAKNCLAHEFYEHLNMDVYAWNTAASGGKVMVSVYNRATDELFNMPTNLTDGSGLAFEVGLGRDGARAVLLRHTITGSKSTEYYVSKNGFSGMTPTPYVQGTYVTNRTNANYARNPAPVLVTELGAVTAGKVTVVHRGVAYSDAVVASLHIDTTTGELVVQNCSVSQSTVASTSPSSTISYYDGATQLFHDNIFRTGPLVSNTNQYTTANKNITIPNIKSPGTLEQIGVYISDQGDTSGLSTFTNIMGFQSLSSTRKLSTSYGGIRSFYITVNGQNTILYRDYIENDYPGGTNGAVFGITFSGIEFIGPKSDNNYILSGMFVTTIGSSNLTPHGKEYVTFKFHKYSSGSRMTFAAAGAGLPLKVTQKKTEYMELSNFYASWAYQYRSAPLGISLNSVFPNKSTYYVPDTVAYNVHIDTDGDIVPVDSLQMYINGNSVSTKTSLKAGDNAEFLIPIESNYDSKIVVDGANQIQFRLNASGDVINFGVVMNKGKLYKLDKAPDLKPTSIVNKAYLRAYNGDTEITPLNSIKTQSSSGVTEYVYKYRITYPAVVNDMKLRIEGNRTGNEKVEINKLIAVLEGGVE